MTYLYAELSKSHLIHTHKNENERQNTEENKNPAFLIPLEITALFSSFPHKKGSFPIGLPVQSPVNCTLFIHLIFFSFKKTYSFTFVFCSE